MACPLEAFVLALISTQLFWKGVIVIPAKDYTVNVSISHVLVEQGLCATVPCTFTYNKDDAREGETLNGFWKKRISNEDNTVADSTKMLAEDRFQIIGNLTAGNCSLLIWKPQEDDEGDYLFRMEKAPDAKYSFVKGTIHLKVTGRQLPEITMDTMRAGNSTSITCATLGGCSRMPPNITWKGLPKHIVPQVHLNVTQIYTSVYTFTPSPADHKRNVTCRVNYTNETTRTPRKKTVQLNVTFEPQMLGINGERIHSNKSQENCTNISRLSVEKGDSIRVRCKVRGNPSPNVTWIKGTKVFQPPHVLHVLKLSDLQVEDSGKYTCQATNQLGKNETSFELAVIDPSTTLLLIVTGALATLVVIVLIPGIILASKRCRRKRKTVEGSEAENTSTDVKKPNTLGLTAQDVNGVASKPRSTHESVDGDPEEIHYATLKFNAPNPKPNITAEDVQTDYAEIYPCNSQGKEA